jgi:CheY-like chemotaxis protein
MDLKNRRIALHIDDPELRYQLSELLMKNGAVVHGARDEVELQQLLDKLGVEVVIAEARPDRSRLN